VSKNIVVQLDTAVDPSPTIPSADTLSRPATLTCTGWRPTTGAGEDPLGLDDHAGAATARGAAGPTAERSGPQVLNT
jgi:hypothetical protein